MTITVCPASSSWRRRAVRQRTRRLLSTDMLRMSVMVFAAEGDFQGFGAEARAICKRRK